MNQNIKNDLIVNYLIVVNRNNTSITQIKIHSRNRRMRIHCKIYLQWILWRWNNGTIGEEERERTFQKSDSSAPMQVLRLSM
jgi:hypothetical protein